MKHLNSFIIFLHKIVVNNSPVSYDNVLLLFLKRSAVLYLNVSVFSEASIYLFIYLLSLLNYEII